MNEVADRRETGAVPGAEPAAPREERYWSRFVETYDAWTEYVVGRSLRSAVAERLREERDLGDLVEFGCGTGFFTRAVADRAARVLATDLSDEMLAAARARLSALPNVCTEKVDCERASLPAARFDTVLTTNVLHVIRDPRAALRECHRVLRPGGRLIAVVYTDDGMPWLAKAALALRYFVTFGFPPAGGIRNYDHDAFRRLAEEAGFAVDEVLRLGAGPRALYLRARRAGAPRSRP